MFVKRWNAITASAAQRTADAKTELARLDRKTDQLMERLVLADSMTLITAYENQIAKLEEQKAALREKAIDKAVPARSFEDTYRTACTFLANPWKLWASDLLEHKRMVLRLVFPGRLAYCRNEGYRTAGIAEPFRLLGLFSTPKCGLVEPRGIEPLTSSLRTTRSPN